jgi:hypothetical protein
MTPHALQHEPIYDIVPETGVSIEVFYSDRTLETFGRCGAGWFWWPRRHGCAPGGSAAGPFATSYAAYRHALPRVSVSVPRSHTLSATVDNERRHDAENRGGGINAVSTPENASSCWGGSRRVFLSEIRW